MESLSLRIGRGPCTLEVFKSEINEVNYCFDLSKVTFWETLGKSVKK